MSYPFRFLGALACVVLSTLLGAPSLVLSQDSLEAARQHLIDRRFSEALIAAEASADQLGLESAAGYHAAYASAGYDTASAHLYRGLALELNRRFPEARADYDVFLSIEPDSWRAVELRKRYAYVNGQAVRFDARTLRDDDVVPEASEAPYGVGVFPLYNSSTILVMSQVAFGLTGVLNNTLGLLDHFSDQRMPLLPYSELRLLLDEIIPEEVYGEGATIDAGSLARVLRTEFLGSGVLDEVSGSLTGHMSIGRYDDLSMISLEDLQANYTPIGLLDLQRELSLAIADSIQSVTGFEYVPSRQAFADSLESLLIEDVGTLLTYGFAFEQLLLGEPVEAQALMMELAIPVAARDLEQIDAVVTGSTPPGDNILILTGLAPAVAPVVAPVALQPDSSVTDSMGVQQALADTASAPSVPAAIQETRTAHALSAAAGRHLGVFSLWGPLVKTSSFDNLKRGDPRAGVAGTLDPTRTVPGAEGVEIEVVIPVPSTPKAGQGRSR